MAKRPLKEKKQLKERWGIEEGVFDKKTLLTVAKIIKKGIIDSLDYCVSTGKEANVYRATRGSENLAVKIYKIETTGFERRDRYLKGDSRFRNIRWDERSITYAFARKEFKNLEIAEEAGVHAPKPYYVENNIVVMSFLGKEGLPYPKLKDTKIIREEDLESILDDIKKMYKVGFVHGDISEYNVLLGDVPYIIDFSEGVVKGHPLFEELLERDVKNILNYYGKHGVRREEKKVLGWVKS
ncbi:MAG: serine protein kinase RIO [Candidatus Anstonellales archaeon]